MHLLLNGSFARPKKKKKSVAENGEGSSAVQPNEIEIIFRNHTALPPSIGTIVRSNQALEVVGVI